MQQQLLAELPSPLNTTATNELQSVLERQRLALAEAPNLPALMGLEGAAAAAWFGWLADHLPAHWKFAGRNRRPPRDPVNALLSLGYTLLGAEMLSVVQEAGLDPALGFLHGVAPGRESLMLDLIEALRPGVDMFVLGLLDTTLTPDLFTRQPVQGCRMNKEGRALFYPAWANARRAWPLPLAPSIGLGGKPEVMATAEDGPDAQTDQSLRVQCRRMVRVLRVLLRMPDDEAVTEESGIDG
jgi:CRISPR-associated protein Cas1